jgi:hypothetical protein
MRRYLAKTDLAELQLPRLPTEDESVFLVSVLDGSDQFADSHGDGPASAKEELHREICGSCIAAADGVWLTEYERSFRDAIFARFIGPEGVLLAVTAAAAIHRRLSLWNMEHQLGWIDQVHARIAFGPERVEKAAVLLKRAVRGDILVHDALLEKCKEVRIPLTRLPFKVCSGIDQRKWDDVVEQIETGVILAGEESHVGRRFVRHAARFAEFRVARTEYLRSVI